MNNFNIHKYFKNQYLEDSNTNPSTNSQSEMKDTTFNRMQALAGINLNESKKISTTDSSLNENLKSRVKEIIMSKLSEAKKDEDIPEDMPEDTEDIFGDETVSDEGRGEINVTQDAEADLSGTKGNVQDNLEAALKAAQDLGDQKLVNQIKNTLTFFTRSQVGQVS